jgi:hypothetical protein
MSYKKIIRFSVVAAIVLTALMLATTNRIHARTQGPSSDVETRLYLLEDQMITAKRKIMTLEGQVRDLEDK